MMPSVSVGDGSQASTLNVPDPEVKSTVAANVKQVILDYVLVSYEKMFLIVLNRPGTM
jgi:hypothetical protein